MDRLSLDTSQKIADRIDLLGEAHQFDKNTLSVGEQVIEAWMFWPGGEDEARGAVRRMLGMKSDIFRVTLSPIEYQTTDLHDQRIIVDEATAKEWRGCRVMLGLARIASAAPILHLSLKGGEFLASLSPEELEYLREVTRKVGKRYGFPALTDADCDSVIAEQGPDTVNKLLLNKT
jgi:hypothetical protein